METEKEEAGGGEKQDLKVVCVEYPGRVENVDLMVETLGGLNNLARVFTDNARRLEVRFRPRDVFCKPTCADRKSVSCLLLKVKKVRKTRRCCGASKEEVRTEIVFQFDSAYDFTNMCDFQYLPTETTSELVPGSSQPQQSSAKPKTFVHEPILDEVYFHKLVDFKWLMDAKDAPLFLPPAAFSRMDQPQDYHYRKDTTGTSSKSSSSSYLGMPLNIIGRTRQRRTLHAIFVNYDVDEVPEKSNEVAMNQLKLKFIEQDERKRVEEAFRDQAVWTKSGLNCATAVSMERLKYVIPTVAYYFTSGPWRNQWVRFGYDPRKNPEAAAFQTLDFRVRVEGGAKLKVRAKRSYANYLLPYKSMNWSKPKTSTISSEAFNLDGDEVPDQEPREEQGALEKSRYLFEEGMIPPHRQMFYQYKDIMVPEVQDAFSAALKKNKACDEKNGWYKPGADNEAREIMSKAIAKSLNAGKKDDSILGDDAEMDYDEEEDEENGRGDAEDVGEIVDEIMEEELEAGSKFEELDLT